MRDIVLKKCREPCPYWLGQLSAGNVAKYSTSKRGAIKDVYLRRSGAGASMTAIHGTCCWCLKTEILCKMKVIRCLADLKNYHTASEEMSGQGTAIPGQEVAKLAGSELASTQADT